MLPSCWGQENGSKITAKTNPTHEYSNPNPEVRRAVVRGTRRALDCSSRWPWASVSPKPMSDSQVRQAFTHTRHPERPSGHGKSISENITALCLPRPAARVKSEGGHVRTLAQNYLKSQLSSSLTSGCAYLDAGELCQAVK